MTTVGKNVMLWDEIYGQEEVVAHLRQVADSKAVSHAYLFVGPRGVGKKKAAKIFAATLNCSTNGCGKCLSCRRILNETHPDVFCLEPEGNYLTIGQVREIQHEASLKSLEGGYKVVILDEVEKMTPEAANAMLKILEEPPEGLLFILIAERLTGILPTVSSRCQSVRFKAVPPATMKKLLQDNYNLSEDKAQLLSKISSGVFGTALVFAQDEAKLKRRAKLFKLVKELAKKNPSEVISCAAEVISETRKPLQALKEKQKKDMEAVAETALDSAHLAHIKRRFLQKQKRELNRAERLNFEEVLTTLASWYRDILVLTQLESTSLSNSEENLVVNIDQLKELKIVSSYLTFDKAQEGLDTICDLKHKLRLNANIPLAFEAAFLKLQEVAP